MKNAEANPVVVFMALCVLGILAAWVALAHFEAKAYNRLTGAHVTTWDAMWVNLRVQEKTKDQ